MKTMFLKQIPIISVIKQKLNLIRLVSNVRHVIQKMRHVAIIISKNVTIIAIARKMKLVAKSNVDQCVIHLRESERKYFQV